MSFNYAKEKRIFDHEWKENWKFYKASGMADEDIQKMKDFDWRWFCSRRKFAVHTQPLPCEKINGEDNDNFSTLLRKFSSLTVELKKDLEQDRYGWVDEVQNDSLHTKLISLSKDDLELLTLIAID